MKRLIYLKKWIIVRPSCFALKERSALKKKSSPIYLGPKKKSSPIYLGPKKKSSPIYVGPKNLLSNRINWVSRIEEQRKIIKNNEEKNPKLLFVHVHVYA